MHITIINDCRDANAAGRQMTRITSLLKAPVVFIGVDAGNGAADAAADIQAAGNLIDTLDASLGEDQVILVNVAPRAKRGKKWPNGTPFGYFYYQGTLVVTTVDGLVLSLVKKLQLVDAINLVDVPTVATEMRETGFIDEVTEMYLGETQFRSFDFAPRLAAFLKAGHAVSVTDYNLTEVLDVDGVIWWIDNFGNAKTTALFEDIQDRLEDDTLETKFGKLKVYKRLKDVPDGEVGMVVGSSGIGNKRFMEIVMQGGSVAQQLGIQTGSAFI